MNKADLEMAWERARRLCESDGFIDRVIRQAITTHPTCPPSREDMAEAAVALCQVVKAAIAVAEAIADRMHHS